MFNAVLYTLLVTFRFTPDCLCLPSTVVQNSCEKWLCKVLVQKECTKQLGKRATEAMATVWPGAAHTKQSFGAQAL